MRRAEAVWDGRCIMGEVPPGSFHRREAARFFRLAELTRDPSLKQKLGKIATRHDRIALQLQAAEAAAPVQGNGERTVESYRLYFIEAGHFAATHDFEAETDVAALAVAYALQEACSDFYNHFELWQGSRVIARSADRRGPKRLPHLAEITAQMQERVLQTEEILLQSREAIAGSRKLLASTAELRAELTRRR
jgi:hypothetical protein